MKKNLLVKVYQIVSKIPKGKVMTYGDVAILMGNKNFARLVGTALHKNPDPLRIPCHRVVNRLGEVAKSFALGGAAQQMKKLKQEGVRFCGGKVDLEKCKINS